MVSCGECNSTDVDIEGNFCNECGEELQEETEEKEMLIVVGLIKEAEPVPKKDKLTKLKVEIGEGKEVTIVTNAKHCDPEKVVVVALVGAKVPTMDEPIEKAVVGGVSLGANKIWRQSDELEERWKGERVKKEKRGQRECYVTAQCWAGVEGQQVRQYFFRATSSQGTSHQNLDQELHKSSQSRWSYL